MTKEYTTMTKEVRLRLIEHKRRNPALTQLLLIQWLRDTFQLVVTQATVSHTLNRAHQYLNPEDTQGMHGKHRRKVKYPDMEKALLRWLNENSARRVPGQEMKDVAATLLDKHYPDHEPLHFSNGWLDAFKMRHGLRKSRSARLHDRDEHDETQEQGASGAPGMQQSDVDDDPRVQTEREGPPELDQVAPASEVLSMLWKLECYFLQQDGDATQSLDALQRMRDEVWRMRRRSMPRRAPPPPFA